jgi:alpha/beta superfamily hydrolase
VEFVLGYANRRRWPPAFTNIVNKLTPEFLLEHSCGFDLYRSYDGVNWVPVTTNGMGNPYNMGLRTLVSTPHGMFIGTANPFGPKIMPLGGDRYVPNPRGLRGLPGLFGCLRARRVNRPGPRALDGACVAPSQRTIHARSKQALGSGCSGGLLMTPAFGALRDAIVDRVLSRRIEAAQESGEFGEGKSEPLTLPSYVKAQLDVSYGADPAQRMDVYMPAARNGHAPMPVIFMVHGGAWMIGDKSTANVVMNKITRWIPKGYVVVCPNYRMLPKTDVQGEVDDVGKALAYAQAAADWGGDASRFVLMGHSAGAHLVSLMSAAPELALNQGPAPGWAPCRWTARRWTSCAPCRRSITASTTRCSARTRASGSRCRPMDACARRRRR